MAYDPRPNTLNGVPMHGFSPSDRSDGSGLGLTTATTVSCMAQLPSPNPTVQVVPHRP